MGSSGALLRSTGMLTFVGCPAGELDRLLWSSCYPLAWMLMASVHWLLLPRSLTGGKRHSAILGLHVTLFLKSLCLTALYRSRINLNLWKTCSVFPILHVSLHFLPLQEELCSWTCKAVAPCDVYDRLKKTRVEQYDGLVTKGGHLS